MTIDEAIKHCLDIADGQDKCAEISVSEHAKERISQCAADHRQLAEWLTELKEAKRLLKAAVKDFDKLVELVEYSDNNRGIGCIITDEGHHDECPLNDGMTCGWWHKDEALKLIGGSENG